VTIKTLEERRKRLLIKLAKRKTIKGKARVAKQISRFNRDYGEVLP